MEPVTIIIGLGLLKLLSSKKGTPAAAAQTVSQVDQLTASIENGGISTVNQVIGALKNQVQGLGLKVGGVGHPAGADGRAYSLHIEPVSGSILTNEDVKAYNLSPKWDSLDALVAIANKDGIFDHSEAVNFITLANEIATNLYQLAQVKESKEAAKKA